MQYLQFPNLMIFCGKKVDKVYVLFQTGMCELWMYSTLPSQVLGHLLPPTQTSRASLMTHYFLKSFFRNLKKVVTFWSHYLVRDRDSLQFQVVIHGLVVYSLFWQVIIFTKQKHSLLFKLILCLLYRLITSKFPKRMSIKSLPI